MNQNLPENNQIDTDNTSIPNAQPTMEIPNEQTPQPFVNDKPKSSPKIIFLIIPAVLLILFGIGLLYTTQNSDTSVNKDNMEQTSELDVSNDAPIQTDIISFLRTNNSQVGIPQGWEVNISNKTATSVSARAFLPNEDETTTFVEIQIAPTAEYVSNPILEFSSKEVVNDITIQKGKEDFLNSNRVVLELLSENNNTKTSLTLFAPNEDKINQYQQSLMDMIGSTQRNRQSTFFKLMPQAYAQAPSNPPEASPSATIAGISILEAKPLEVMEGPYPERITNTDTQYQDGYAKLYSFEYIPGQRIEALVEENTEDRTANGSFIATELWEIDQNGTSNKLLDTGTRLDMKNLNLSAGTYYIVARSFDNKEGRILIKIFDLNQVTDLYYAKYADGSEHLINGNPAVSVNQPAVLLVRFTSPVEIVSQDTVRWFRKPNNSCIDCKPSGFGDITVPITVSVNQIETQIKTTKLFANQAIIEPAQGGGFPLNSKINFNLDFGKSEQGVGSGYSGSFSTY